MIEERLEDLPVWDQSSLMKRLLGKQALKERLIKLFVKDFPSRQAQLEEALNTGDLEHIAAVSHAIKGMASNISGVRFQALAARIEMAAKAGDAEAVAGLAPLLPDTAADLLCALTEDQSVVVDSSADAKRASQNLAKVGVTEYQDTLSQLHGKLQRGELIDPSSIPVLSTCARHSVTFISEAGETVLEANLVQQTNKLCQLIECFDFQPALSLVGDMMRVVPGDESEASH